MLTLIQSQVVNIKIIQMLFGNKSDSNKNDIVYLFLSN